MKYTADQIQAAVEAPGEETWRDAETWLPAGVREDYWGTKKNHPDNRLVLDIDGEKVYAEYIGGKPPEEGGGERVYIIVKVGEQFFRKNGYYASHYGTDWDGSVDEVHPVTKTITVYETR